MRSTYQSIVMLVIFGALALAAFMFWSALTTQVDTSPVVSAEIMPLGDELPDTKIQRGGIETFEQMDLSETLNRPLFFPGRKEPNPNISKGPKPAPKTVEIKPVVTKRHLPDGIKLVGILEDANRERHALIRDASTPLGKWLELGGEVRGWKIASIEKQSVTVRSGGQSYVLKLHGNEAEKN